MATIFNDIGQPSSKPCAGGWLRDCDRGDYASWYRKAREMDAWLAVVEDSGEPDQRAVATAERALFAVFPEPGILSSAGGIPTSPSRAKSVAAWAQHVADILSREGSAVTLPPSLFEAPHRESDIPPFLTGVGAGIVVGGILVVGGVWYAKTREWI